MGGGVERWFSVPLYAKFLVFQTGHAGYFRLAQNELPLRSPFAWYLLVPFFILVEMIKEII